MAGYVLLIIFTLYLGICFGLLNQASVIKGLNCTKSFIPIIPLVYVFLLLRAIYRFFVERTNDRKAILLIHLHLKISLLIILFSYSQVQKEIKAKKRTHTIHGPINYSEYIKLGTKKAWDNAVCVAQ